MRRRPLLATLLACAPLAALAQTDAPMELGIPGDSVFANPSAFIRVDTFGDTLLLQAHPGFVPVVADYTANAPQQQINVSICGVTFPPFSPIAPSPNGLLEIPLGTPENASAAADVMAGRFGCDAVTLTLLGPEIPTQNLRITSPSDVRDVPPGDIVAASAIFDDVTGQYMISLTFGAELSAWFATETGEHVGEIIEIIVCNEVVTAPIVREVIANGAVVISGNLTKPEAETQVARIRGEFHCP